MHNRFAIRGTIKTCLYVSVAQRYWRMLQCIYPLAVVIAFGSFYVFVKISLCVNMCNCLKYGTNEVLCQIIN